MPNLSLEKIRDQLKVSPGGFIVLQKGAILSYGTKDQKNYRAVITAEGEQRNEYHGDLDGLMALVSQFRRKTRKKEEKQ